MANEEKRTDREGDVFAQAIIYDADGIPEYIGKDINTGFDGSGELTPDAFKAAFRDPDGVEIRDLGVAGAVKKV